MNAWVRDTVLIARGMFLFSSQTFCGRHVSIATTPMKLLALNEVTPSPRMLVMLAEHQRHQREAERVGGDFLCS